MAEEESASAPRIAGLRRASAEDVPAIAALVRAAYSKYVPRLGRTPKPMMADYSVSIARHQVWVLEEKGTLIAVLELIPGSGHLLIENIALLPAHQGRGLGRKLMAFAEEEARRQGAGEMRLYTNEAFSENLAFYKRLGYRETEYEPFEGTELVHLAKRLLPGHSQ